MRNSNLQPAFVTDTNDTECLSASKRELILQLRSAQTIEQYRQILKDNYKWETPVGEVFNSHHQRLEKLKTERKQAVKRYFDNESSGEQPLFMHKRVSAEHRKLQPE